MGHRLEKKRRRMLSILALRIVPQEDLAADRATRRRAINEAIKALRRKH